MKSNDEWSHDPSVQSMRKIFSHMEKAYNHYLISTETKPFDARLSDIKKEALVLFESVYSTALSKNYQIDEKSYVEIYRLCLSKVFITQNIKLPENLLLENNPFHSLIREQDT